MEEEQRPVMDIESGREVMAKHQVVADFIGGALSGIALHPARAEWGRGTEPTRPFCGYRRYAGLGVGADGDACFRPHALMDGLMKSDPAHWVHRKEGYGCF